MGILRKVFSKGKYGIGGFSRNERVVKILTPSVVDVQKARERVDKLKRECKFVLALANSLRCQLEGMGREESGLSDMNMEVIDFYQEIPERMGYDGVWSAQFYGHWAEIASYEGLDVIKLRRRLGRTQPVYMVEGKEEYFQRTPGQDNPKRPYGYVLINQLHWFYVRSVQREMKTRRGEIRPL